MAFVALGVHVEDVDGAAVEFSTSTHPVLSFVLNAKRSHRPDAVLMQDDGRLCLLSDLDEPGWSLARVLPADAAPLAREAAIAEMRRVLTHQRRLQGEEVRP
jgi:hypothetical protein